MITPPCSGTFSTPLNSIFHNARLQTLTTGRIISSAHCGSIVELAAARGSSLLIGDVPLLLTVLTVVFVCILQRPFLIYELDVNSRNAISARASCANRCMCRDPVLLARQTNETS